MASAADAFSETNSLLDRGPVGIAIVRASATISYGTSTRLYRDVEYIAGRKTARDRERGGRANVYLLFGGEGPRKKEARRASSGVRMRDIYYTADEFLEFIIYPRLSSLPATAN